MKIKQTAGREQLGNFAPDFAHSDCSHGQARGVLIIKCSL